MIKIEFFHNVAKDYRGRNLGFGGYEPGHQVVKVFEADVVEGYAEDMAEQAFRIGNGVDNASDTYYGRKLRSMSVGDVIRIDGKWWACQHIGWKELDHDPIDITDSHEGEHGTQPWKE